MKATLRYMNQLPKTGEAKDFQGERIHFEQISIGPEGLSRVIVEGKPRFIILTCNLISFEVEE